MPRPMSCSVPTSGPTSPLPCPPAGWHHRLKIPCSGRWCQWGWRNGTGALGRLPESPRRVPSRRHHLGTGWHRDRGSPSHIPVERPTVCPSLCRWLWVVPMAKKSDTRDSESSWVLAGSEGLPIDTVGPEQDSTCHRAEDEEPQEKEDEGTQDTATGRELPWGWGRPDVIPSATALPLMLCVSPAMTTNGAATFPGWTPCPEDPEECVGPKAQAVPAPDGSTELSVMKGDEQEECDAEAEPQSCPDTPKAGPPMEDGSCTSSDNDTEGLRQRQGHKPHPGPPTATSALHRRTPDTGGEEGLSMSKYLLGALALVVVGLLIITGGIYDPSDGPVESMRSWDLPAGEQDLLLSTDSSDSQQKPTLPDAGNPQSVQSISQLLDKLAKENQEIRLMQAELQAHKDELQALLHRSEGEAAAAGTQQQSLAMENAQLRAALEREVSALRDAQAELQRLQARGEPSSPREPSAEQPCTTGAPVRSKTARRWDGELGLLRQELVDTLERVQGSGDLEGLVGKLNTLEQRLAQLLEVEGAQSFPTRWKKPFKVEKESRRHKQHSTRGAPHERERKEYDKSHRQKKDPQSPQEHKPGKAWRKQFHSHPQHGSRELPLFKQYRAPQGCSGVADCAHKEGWEVLGAALEPVQKAQFLQLLASFMGRLGLGGHFEGLAAQLDGVFGADGVFAHDRLRFVDFVDDVEELLEKVAWQEGGDKKAADGFEEYMLRHYRGTSRNEWGRRAPQQHGTVG